MRATVAQEFPPLLLTEGGPGDALLRRLKLQPLGVGARRAAIVLAAVTWIPLLVLSAIHGTAVSGPQIPFLYDLAAHVRFLVALPVLILAEIPIGFRLRQAAAHFVSAGLVGPDEHAKFAGIILATRRLRDSRLAEFLVFAAACVTAYGVLSEAGFQGGSTWHAPEPHARRALPGLWYALVAIPIFQFVLYRWLYRMFVWAWFLRRMSALRLQLTPTHPDGAGGLAFLGEACIPFGTLLFAVSAVVSSAIATRVLFAGAALQAFQLSYAALVVIAVAVFVGPLLVFVPVLLGVKRRGLHEYGTLASRYTQLFERKWVERAEAQEEPLLGTADIQSLADLGSSYDRVKSMRAAPITMGNFVAMAVPGILPAIPLAATVMPVSEIMTGLLKLLV